MDLIDRQSAIDALRRLYIENPQINNDFVYDMALDQADDAIKQLPLVQSKRGKWLDANICGELPVIVCDQCNTFYPLSFGEFHNFCPNCGAKMEG